MLVKQVVNGMTGQMFYGEFECELCGEEMDGYGSNDLHFYQNVLPYVKCPECGKCTLSRRRYVIEFEAEGEIDTKMLLSAKQCFGDFSFFGVTCRYTDVREEKV